MDEDRTIASPVLVARAMAARGARREAEIVLRGAVARDPAATDCRSELIRWTRGIEPVASDAELSLEVVDAWIRNGMLVEALALLGGIDLGGPAREWADLLGELLAPVPAHAPPAFMQMHRALMTGAASVAMAILEDWPERAPLPGWATRRLELLRWMLLDNARTAEDDRPAGEAPSLLASALREGLARRSLDAMLQSARAHGGGTPDSDTRLVVEALERLCAEARLLGADEAPSSHTVPVHGRAAASMQLCMANLHGAGAIYRKLSQGKPSDAELAALSNAVRGVRRVLEGRPFVDRAQPPTARMTAGFDDPTAAPTEFEDETVTFVGQTAMAMSPMAYGAPTNLDVMQTRGEPDETTREVDLHEMQRANAGFADVTVDGTVPLGQRGRAAEDELTKEVAIEGSPDFADDVTRDVSSRQRASTRPASMMVDPVTGEDVHVFSRPVDSGSGSASTKAAADGAPRGKSRARAPTRSPALPEELEAARAAGAAAKVKSESLEPGAFPSEPDVVHASEGPSASTPETPASSAPRAESFDVATDMNFPKAPNLPSKDAPLISSAYADESTVPSAFRTLEVPAPDQEADDEVDKETDRYSTRAPSAPGVERRDSVLVASIVPVGEDP